MRDQIPWRSQLLGPNSPIAPFDSSKFHQDCEVWIYRRNQQRVDSCSQTLHLSVFWSNPEMVRFCPSHFSSTGDSNLQEIWRVSDATQNIQSRLQFKSNTTCYPAPVQSMIAQLTEEKFAPLQHWHCMTSEV